MALLEIIKVPDELLRKVSKPVERFDGRLHTLLDDMHETMQKAHGAGLAAVQVGYLLRACLVDDMKGQVVELINPTIIKACNERKGAEGCLSVPGASVRVKRARDITVKAQDRHGNWFEQRFTGIPAVCVQHEMDHMEGVLIG